MARKDDPPGWPAQSEKLFDMEARGVLPRADAPAPPSPPAPPPREATPKPSFWATLLRAIRG